MIDEGQMRAARALLGLTQEDIAQRTGISVQTIKRMETLGPGRSSANNVAAVQGVLEAAGIQFIAENGGGAGLRLAKPKGATD